MDTIVRPPEAPPDPPTTSARRRRWPRRLLTGIALLVVVSVAASLLWAENVQPLQRGSFGWSTDPVPAVALDLSTFRADDGPSHVNCFEADPGTTVRYRFSIRNGSPVPIRIESVSPGLDDPGMVVTRHPVRMIPDIVAAMTYGRQPTWEPFQPFELAPHTEGSIEMEATVRERIGRGGLLGIQGEEIHYSILGVQRAETFSPAVAVYFADDPRAACTTG